MSSPSNREAPLLAGAASNPSSAPRTMHQAEFHSDPSQLTTLNSGPAHVGGFAGAGQAWRRPAELPRGLTSLARPDATAPPENSMNHAAGSGSARGRGGAYGNLDDILRDDDDDGDAEVEAMDAHGDLFATVRPGRTAGLGTPPSGPSYAGPTMSSLGAEGAVDEDTAGISEGMRGVYRRVETRRKQLAQAYREYRQDIGMNLAKPTEEIGGPHSEHFLRNWVEYLRRLPVASAQPGGGHSPSHSSPLLGTAGGGGSGFAAPGPSAPGKGKGGQPQSGAGASSLATLGKTIHMKIVDKNMLRQDTAVAALSMLGVIFMLVATVIAWIPRRHPTTAVGACSVAVPQYLETELSALVKTTVTVLTWCILLSTVLCVIAIARLYSMALTQKQIEWCRINGVEIMPRRDAYVFLKSTGPFKLALEVIIHLLCPYPWYNSLTTGTSSIAAGTDSEAKYLSLLMLLRVYTVMRLLHHMSPLYRFRNDIIAASPSLKATNFQVRMVDTAKVYFYQYTVTAGVVMYALVAIVGGFAVWIAERDSNNGCDPTPAFPGRVGTGFNTWFEGIYFVVTSVRTIGYGDLLPITYVGRVLSMFFQIAGMSVEAFLGSVVINKIAQTREERMIDEYLKSFNAWHDLRVASALLIQAAWKTSLRYKYLHRLVPRAVMERIMRTAKRRVDLRRRLQASSTAFPVLGYEGLATGDENRALQFAGTRARIAQNQATSALGLKTIVALFRNAGPLGGGAAGDDADLEGAAAAAADAHVDPLRVLERMPYLRPRERETDSATIIQRSGRIFTQDVDLGAWGRHAADTRPPPGLKATTRFTASRRVVSTSGQQRRVPIGAGHKANIVLEAQRRFRAARLKFRQSLAAAADHVIDAKLLMTYELLVDASRKVRRNAMLLRGLQRVTEIELDSVDRVVTLTMSGGVDA